MKANAHTGSKPYVSVKDAHIQTCLSQPVESSRSSGLETIELAPGFPEFHRADMDTTCIFMGKRLSLPLIISPITGGGELSGKVNVNLAIAAERLSIAMAVGSQRPMLEGKALPDSYLLRQYAPSIPFLANLGLLHARLGLEYLLRAVECIDADGIILYVNPLHEILQADGEEDFSEALNTAARIISDFPYPVFIKEVGFGISDSVLAWAAQQGIQGVDVAGLGGTNWARIEGIVQGKDYALYENLGRPTIAAIESAKGLLRSDQQLIASGGIRTGMDMARTFSLGADLTGMALPFLKWAAQSADVIIANVERIRKELLTVMWFAGARTPKDLTGKIESRK